MTVDIKYRDKDQDIDLESYLLKILPGQISIDQRRTRYKMPGCRLKDRSDPENG